MTQANDSAPRTWQQTKSQNTRESILNAAIDCIYEKGYGRTTTERVARKAGVSRGAMLHHFPTRQALISATVHHLNDLRLQAFAAEESRIQEGQHYSLIEEGIETYWEQLKSPLFTVFQELQILSRTDTELAEVMRPAIEEYDRAWIKAVQNLFPDLAESRAHGLASLTTQFLLEGLALNRETRSNPRRERLVVDGLKAQLRTLYSDVTESVDRASARRRAGQDG